MSYRRAKSRKRKSEADETQKKKVKTAIVKPIYVRRIVKWEKKSIWCKETKEFLASTDEIHTSVFKDDPSGMEISIPRRLGYSGAEVTVKQQILIPHSVAYPADRNDRL